MLDYLFTIVVAAAVVAGGYYYACDFRQWCGVRAPQGVSVRTVVASLPEAPAAAQQETAAAERTEPTKEGDDAAPSTPVADTSDVTTATAEAPTPPARQKQCAPYLTKDIRPGRRNDRDEVIKLEKFLNAHEGEHLIAGGVYDATDQAAVRRFQEKYAEDILAPAGLRRGTALVLQGTRAKINALACEAGMAPAHGNSSGKK